MREEGRGEGLPGGADLGGLDLHGPLPLKLLLECEEVWVLLERPVLSAARAIARALNERRRGPERRYSS